MAGDGFHITREQIDAMILAEASRLVAERVAVLDLAQLTPILDWQPAEWFAQQWGYQPAAATGLLKKLRVRISTLSQKTRLYSVTDANAKIAERGLVPPAKRRSTVIDFQQPELPHARTA